jgi:hypothetical protein
LNNPISTELIFRRDAFCKDKLTAGGPMFEGGFRAEVTSFCGKDNSGSIGSMKKGKSNGMSVDVPGNRRTNIP